MIFLKLDHTNTFTLLEAKESERAKTSYQMQGYNVKDVYDFFESILLEKYDDKDIRLDLMENIVSLVSAKYQQDVTVKERNLGLFKEAYLDICEAYSTYPKYDLIKDLSDVEKYNQY